MKLLDNELGTFTDMYQLTMMESYFLENRHKHYAAFDYFFRKIPFSGGFVVLAGLQELLEYLNNLKFSSDDINYLQSLKMNSDFLEYLKTFSFNATITSVPEGSLVFPAEPVLTVEGNLLEVQLAETILLNILNFNSLIATKAARIRLVAPDKILIDFGLRRAQGFGGIQASKAAIIGGFDSTSNVFASKYYNLNPVGTMAHSFIQGFDDEISAFRSFANTHPDNCVLLVDTYNTLKSGIPNAITIAKELEKKGYRLKAIRLDSGDLAYLSKKARKMLDENNLHYVKIAASNQLDEIIIKSLSEQDAQIDIFGVGTNLVTGQPDGALDGVYKLAQINDKPALKLSENVNKITLPGLKKIMRFTDDKGFIQADAVVMRDEVKIEKMFHPADKDKFMELNGLKGTVLNNVVMEEGNVLIKKETSGQIRERVSYNLSRLPIEYKRFEYPHVYKVGISEKLMNLKDELKSNHS